MLDSIANLFQLTKNMGVGYVAYRAKHEIERRTGLLKKRFPTSPPLQEFISREEWKKLPVTFFPFSPGQIDKEALQNLQKRVRAFQKEDLLTFFSSQSYEVSDWLINPDTRYRYSAQKHWTNIPDFSPQAGDIKYVWEKSRFAFLYDLIRYDHHFGEDQSGLVFSEIESWINANPVNRGPNWRCSQEIALRVLNWTFALHYYRDSPALTPARFGQIMHSIYWQMRHVASHIQFSLRAVRNNHALTETLALYLVGLLYPFFPESASWKQKGKGWFEQEIAHQIYKDGTYLQFSMNYHRVVIQLLNWGIRLAHLNGERWAPVVYERAKSSLHFLRVCQDTSTGWLPNYGANDGALFFPLSECHFRDFRPQLYALALVLGETPPYKSGLWAEEAGWLGLDSGAAVSESIPDDTYAFDKGGYYVLREKGTLTFLRCGHFKDRPQQADNLHLDLWGNGENILRDAGSYLYNTEERWTRYFAGTASHNTVMVGDLDQMRKGPRFIWYDWVRESRAGWFYSGERMFEGHFVGFHHSGQAVTHRRRVTKTPGQLHWLVEDWLHGAPARLPMQQIWHPSDYFLKNFTLTAQEQSGHELPPAATEGWYSETYGEKIPTARIVFTTKQRYIKTEIAMIVSPKH
jgi:hypothetical protein